MSELDQQLSKYRLTRDEYQRIEKTLGRAPRGVEWALFSSLWSEHCSYKSSKIYLKKLFRQNARVLESEGENAGVIDLGQGERIAFKMESHNHPSFIEPYQGAATGVGGILRDIFTMGARPIALANYLCFGETKAPRMHALIDGVVRGIGGYGNCVGVPTVTGQTEFHRSYNGNILVNAMAVGLFRPGSKVFLSQARGIGNHVVYVGAKTGRDGVHGASMASESFDENSASKRPTVQIGDPFFEKLLIESCLEAMQEDLVVAIQDMGAAGLTSSSFEMASKGRVGFTLHLDRVPLRDTSVTPEDILLSESQERMLLICEPEKLSRLQSLFHKWELEAAVIGEVTKGPEVSLYWHGELLTSIDPDHLVENAPVYERPFQTYQARHHVTTMDGKKALGLWAGHRNEDLLVEILNRPEACAREWIYRQYDQRVGTQTARDCSESVAVMRLPDSGRALGIVLGCRPTTMRLDVELGGADAVLYPALELASRGFQALAVTDCLNFGNPEKPETMGEFVASLAALSGACQALDAPIISGNVSLYNETLGQSITSTPATGVVGLKDSLEGIPFGYWSQPGLRVVRLFGQQSVWSSGAVSEWASGTLQWQGSQDIHSSAQFVRTVCEIVNAVPIEASRVIGKGGWAYALARLCLKGVGCQVRLALPVEGPHALFAEPFYEVVMALQPENVAKLKALAGSTMMVEEIGQTGGDHLVIDGELKVAVASLTSSYQRGWEKHFEELA